MNETLRKFEREIAEFRRLMDSPEFWSLSFESRESAIERLDRECLEVRGSIEEAEAACGMLLGAVGEYAARLNRRIGMAHTSSLRS